MFNQDKFLPRPFTRDSLIEVIEGVYAEAQYCYTGEYESEREDLKKEEIFVRRFPSYNKVENHSFIIYKLN